MTRKTGWPLRLYRTISPGLVALTPLAGKFSPKLQRGISGRAGLSRRLADAAPALRGCIWFHSTSVGEYEQARPVIAAVKERRPDLPIAVTHFSVSGFDYARKRPSGDFHDYLPFDHPGQMEELLHLWQPRLLVFVKFDLWPNMVLTAEKKNVPIVLVAGSLASTSGRLHPLVRSTYRELFDRFDHLGVCTEDDARRFQQNLGVRCPVTVTGDTRVEQVIIRYEAAADGDTARRLKALGGHLLILGSTWPPDEKLWLPILPQLLAEFSNLRVILTPHEPHEERLIELEATLRSQDVTTVRLSALMADHRAHHRAHHRADQPADAPADARIILVDSIGQLAEIYRAGDLAYVGGSFTTGVHNTMEPAVASLPVLFGPRIRNAEEALVLVQRQAGFVLQQPHEALETTRQLLADPSLLKATGTKARQVVLEQRGATAQSMNVIAPYLDG